MNNNHKTIEHLNKKAWYRFLKVIYIFSFFCVFLMILTLWIDYFFDVDSDIELLKLTLISLIIPIGPIFFLEAIRRAFYYVVLGQVFPNGTEYKFPNISEERKNSLKKNLSFLTSFFVILAPFLLHFSLFLTSLWFFKNYYFHKYIPDQNYEDLYDYENNLNATGSFTLNDDSFVALSAEILCLAADFPEATDKEIEAKAGEIAKKYNASLEDYKKFRL